MDTIYIPGSLLTSSDPQQLDISGGDSQENIFQPHTVTGSCYFGGITTSYVGIDVKCLHSSGDPICPETNSGDNSILTKFRQIPYGKRIEIIRVNRNTNRFFAFILWIFCYSFENTNGILKLARDCRVFISYSKCSDNKRAPNVLDNEENPEPPSNPEVNNEPYWDISREKITLPEKKEEDPSGKAINQMHTSGISPDNCVFCSGYLPITDKKTFTVNVIHFDENNAVVIDKNTTSLNVVVKSGKMYKVNPNPTEAIEIGSDEIKETQKEDGEHQNNAVGSEHCYSFEGSISGKKTFFVYNPDPAKITKIAANYANNALSGHEPSSHPKQPSSVPSSSSLPPPNQQTSSSLPPSNQQTSFTSVCPGGPPPPNSSGSIYSGSSKSPDTPPLVDWNFKDPYAANADHTVVNRDNREKIHKYFTAGTANSITITGLQDMVTKKNDLLVYKATGNTIKCNSFINNTDYNAMHAMITEKNNQYYLKVKKGANGKYQAASAGRYSISYNNKIYTFSVDVNSTDGRMDISHPIFNPKSSKQSNFTDTFGKRLKEKKPTDKLNTINEGNRKMIVDSRKKTNNVVFVDRNYMNALIGKKKTLIAYMIPEDFNNTSYENKAYNALRVEFEDAQNGALISVKYIGKNNRKDILATGDYAMCIDEKIIYFKVRTKGEVYFDETATSSIHPSANHISHFTPASTNQYFQYNSSFASTPVQQSVSLSPQPFQHNIDHLKNKDRIRDGFSRMLKNASQVPTYEFPGNNKVDTNMDIYNNLTNMKHNDGFRYTFICNAIHIDFKYGIHASTNTDVYGFLLNENGALMPICISRRDNKYFLSTLNPNENDSTNSTLYYSLTDTSPVSIFVIPNDIQTTDFVIINPTNDASISKYDTVLGLASGSLLQASRQAHSSQRANTPSQLPPPSQSSLPQNQFLPVSNPQFQHPIATNTFQNLINSGNCNFCVHYSSYDLISKNINIEGSDIGNDLHFLTEHNSSMAIQNTSSIHICNGVWMHKNVSILAYLINGNGQLNPFVAVCDGDGKFHCFLKNEGSANGYTEFGSLGDFNMICIPKINNIIFAITGNYLNRFTAEYIQNEGFTQYINDRFGLGRVNWTHVQQEVQQEVQQMQQMQQMQQNQQIQDSNSTQGQNPNPQNLDLNQQNSNPNQ
jgi:hypothetical protein